MRNTAIAASLALAAAWPFAAHADLPPGVSGSWFNPDQPGHGLSVQMLADDRALAFWYVFDASGQPVHLYIEGDVVGQRLEGTAYLGRGMRFGSFDSAEHQLGLWGTVTLDFTACDQATLSWDPSGPAGGAGFESGSMVVRPLVAVSGLRCDFGATGAVPAGLLAGRHGNAILDRSGGMSARAMVDSDGQVWGIAQDFLLDPGACCFYSEPQVYRGEVADARPTAATLRLTAWDDTGWLTARSRDRDPPAPRALDLPLATGAPIGTDPGLDGPRFADSAVGVAGAGYIPGDELGHSLRLNTPPIGQVAELVERMDQVAGSYRFESRDQFFAYTNEVSISAAGELCLRSEVTEGCEVEGRISLRGEDAFRQLFEVELRDVDHPDRPYQGVGWLEAGPDPVLVLVTTREDRAMGFVLREEG